MHTKTLPTFSLLLLPTLAFANAGSPMIWFGFLHLLILNAVIGWAESYIIAKFNIQNRTWLIIMGNYVSMLIGLFYIAPHFSTIAGNDDFWGVRTNYGDYKLQGFAVGMVSSFFATLILELPFFYLAVKDKLLRRQIFIPFIVANTVTNIIMIAIYCWITQEGSQW